MTFNFCDVCQGADESASMRAESPIAPSQTAMMEAEERRAAEVESSFADLKRATRRLLATRQGSPKWVLEKAYPLNHSQSKRVVIGLCLERRLHICVAIENASGLGIKMGADDLEHLLDRSWEEAVLQHLQEPNAYGKSVRRGGFEFRCTLLRNSEPGLRISALNEEKECYVILGGITCKRLFEMKYALRHKLEMLKRVSQDSDKWLLRYLEGLKSEIYVRALEDNLTEDLALDIVTKGAEFRDSTNICNERFLSNREWDTMRKIWEVDFVHDMMNCHPILVSRMLIDYTKE